VPKGIPLAFAGGIQSHDCWKAGKLQLLQEKKISYKSSKAAVMGTAIPQGRHKKSLRKVIPIGVGATQSLQNSLSSKYFSSNTKAHFFPS